MATYIVTDADPERMTTDHPSIGRAVARACVLVGVPRNSDRAKEALRVVQAHFDATPSEPFEVPIRGLTITMVKD